MSCGITIVFDGYKGLTDVPLNGHVVMGCRLCLALVDEAYTASADTVTESIPIPSGILHPTPWLTGILPSDALIAAYAPTLATVENMKRDNRRRMLYLDRDPNITTDRAKVCRHRCGVT